MAELILALDVGTTSVRAGVVSPQGEILAIAKAALATSAPAPGRAEQDPERVWRAAQAVIRRSLGSARVRAADLAAIGIASQRTSIVLWDRIAGAPLCPMVLWSDLRGISEAAKLRGEGFVMAAQQAAAKLERLAKDAAAPGRRIAYGGVDSFLIWKLSGGSAHLTDWSEAWPTGYFDLTAGGWNRKLMARQGLEEAMFPALGETWGELARVDRRILGAEVAISAVIADQQAALLAHGGAAKLTLGTAACLDIPTGEKAIAKDPAMPPFIVSQVAGKTNWSIEAMAPAAGSALDWLRTLMGRISPAKFEALAASAPSSAGVAFLPALSGLGAPRPDSSRAGALVGLTSSAGRGEIARAAIEGVALTIRDMTEALFRLADHPLPSALGVDGGLSANETLLQSLADALVLPVKRHAEREATLLGAALAAGLGGGLLSQADSARFCRYDRLFEPQIGADEANARHHTWRRAIFAETPVSIS
ncbi:MAG: FGGY family carbohydrate kinase [Caulobacteraceae bacterium]